MFLTSHSQRVNLAIILFILNKDNWNMKSLPGHRMGEAIVCPEMSTGFHYGGLSRSQAFIWFKYYSYARWNVSFTPTNHFLACHNFLF